MSKSFKIKKNEWIKTQEQWIMNSWKWVNHIQNQKSELTPKISESGQIDKTQWTHNMTKRWQKVITSKFCCPAAVWISSFQSQQQNLSFGAIRGLCDCIALNCLFISRNVPFRTPPLLFASTDISIEQQSSSPQVEI